MKGALYPYDWQVAREGGLCIWKLSANKHRDLTAATQEGFPVSSSTTQNSESCSKSLRSSFKFSRAADSVNPHEKVRAAWVRLGSALGSLRGVLGCFGGGLGHLQDILGAS